MEVTSYCSLFKITFRSSPPQVKVFVSRHDSRQHTSTRNKTRRFDWLQIKSNEVHSSSFLSSGTTVGCTVIMSLNHPGVSGSRSPGQRPWPRRCGETGLDNTSTGISPFLTLTSPRSVTFPGTEGLSSPAALSGTKHLHPRIKANADGRRP